MPGVSAAEKRTFRPWRDAAIIFIVALIVRLIYAVQLSVTPFFAHPIVDAAFHDAWARDILDLGAGHEGVFFRAPLYPYFLALIYRLSDGSYFAPRLVQSFLGALTAALTYLTAFQLTKRRAAGWFAGLGAALYGMLVYFDGELLVETLFIPLLLGSIYTYARLRAHPRSSALILPGLLLGLAAITRPSALILIPVFLFDQLLLKGSGGVALSRRLFRAFTWTAAVFLPILPVTWHNVYQGGDFVLIASSGGVNFYIGNNPQSDGMHSHFPDWGSNWDVPYASMQAYKAAGRILSPSEVSDYYFREGWRFITERPAEAAKLLMRKFAAFWSSTEISNNRDLYFFVTETRILPYLRLIGFGFLGPLGLLGWTLAWRNKRLPPWFLSILPVYMLGVIAFFVTARFRLPVIPLLWICAAAAMVELFSRTKPLFNRKRLLNLVLLAGFAVFVNNNPVEIYRGNLPHSHFSLGNAFLKAGDYAQAKKAYRYALEADPSYPLVHLNLGVIAYREGDEKTAEEEYRKELEINPEEAMAWNNLGVIFLQKGDLEQAKEYFQRAFELEPYFDDARVNLAECFFKLGLKTAEAGEILPAVENFAQALKLEDSSALYHYNYALGMGRLGYPDIARTHLREAIRLQPDFQEARTLLEQLERQLSSQTEPPP